MFIVVETKDAQSGKLGYVVDIAVSKKAAIRKVKTHTQRVEEVRGKPPQRGEIV